ncbi:MAG: soluble lytic murein transglycosylase-like protein, partial [Flavobacteriales bacterium]
AFETVPRLINASPWAPETLEAPTFVNEIADAVDERALILDAFLWATQAVSLASENAIAYNALPRTPGLLDAAAQAAEDHHFDDAIAIALRVLEVEQPAHVSIRAREILGFSAMHTENWTLAFESLLAADIAAVQAITPSPLRSGTGEEPSVDGDGAAEGSATSARLPEGVPSADLSEPHWQAIILRSGDRALWLSRSALRVDAYETSLSRAERAVTLLDGHMAVHEAYMLRARAMLGIESMRASGVAEVDAFLERYPEAPSWDRMTLDAAHTERALARYDAALRRADAWLWQHPFHPWSSEAESLIGVLETEHGAVRRTRTVDELAARGREMRLWRHWETARVVLDGALATCTNTATAPLATCNGIRFQIALNEYDSANFETSLLALDEIANTGGAGVSALDMAKWRARNFSRLGRETEAIDVYDGYMRQRGERTRHRTMGEFTFDLGEFELAYEHYDEVWSTSEWAEFDGCILTYFAGHYELASERFERLAHVSSGRLEARALYWLARTRERQLRVEDAIAGYARIAERWPVEYYGVQSQNRLEEWAAARAENPEAMVRASRVARMHWGGFDGAPSASLADVQAATHFPLNEPYVPQIRADGAVQRFAERWSSLFPEAQRAAALLAVGAHEEARVALRPATREFTQIDELFAQGRTPSTRRPIQLETRQWSHTIDNRRAPTGWWGVALTSPMYPVPERRTAREAFVSRHLEIRENRAEIREDLRAALREVSDHYMVRRVIFDHVPLGSLSDPENDRSVWYEAYPMAYGHVAERHLEARNMNPFLLWSLMIVESDLNPDTVSRADAYGMLQVIPKTGELIAGGFGEPDFGVHSLTGVEDAFQYGAWYLNELLVKFDGQELLAMVAYNAGPHQVARWLDWRGDEMELDEFIETVPYSGARRYPMRIVRYMQTYRLIYEDNPRLYIGNTLDLTYEDNIYY